MKRGMQILFYTRLLLYLVAFGLPVVHPAIAVSYDKIGWWLWFGLVPGEMLICFYLSPPGFRFFTWLASAAGFLFISIVVFPGLSTYTLLYIAAGCGSFLLTALIFKAGTWGYSIAVLEQFFVAFVFYKMLSFSRSSESAAKQASGITQLILVLIVCVFLAHGMVLYLSAFARTGSGRGVRELFFFLALAVPFAVILALLLPPDFVSHRIVFNILKPEPEPEPLQLDTRGEGVEGGNLRSDLWDNSRYRGLYGDMGGESGSKQGQPRNGQALEGIPADRWFSQGQGEGQGSQQKQYAVMVVASPIDPVYAAGAYYGKLDPVQGFQLTPDQPLNELTYIHLIDTWKDHSLPDDKKRNPHSIFYLSTLPERVVAYRPYTVEPSVLHKKYHPFDYSYRAVSLVSGSRTGDWKHIAGLSEQEKAALQQYLEVSLPDSVKNSFKTHLHDALGEKSGDGKSSGYLEKIQLIFQSFSDFQYQIGFTDDVSVKALEEFLVHQKKGDCTEFSNAAAVLARMAGVPSRVVTGFLASGKLQTPSHRRGIRILRDAIGPLKKYPLQELYLVTTA
ncbi:MAG: transglutaminase-like domain-containing protein, partial [Spirochaetota bacterium]